MKCIIRDNLLTHGFEICSNMQRWEGFELESVGARDKQNSLPPDAGVTHNCTNTPVLISLVSVSGNFSIFVICRYKALDGVPRRANYIFVQILPVVCATWNAVQCFALYLGSYVITKLQGGAKPSRERFAPVLRSTPPWALARPPNLRIIVSPVSPGRWSFVIHLKGFGTCVMGILRGRW